jgi:hypothetical protein
MSSLYNAYVIKHMENFIVKYTRYNPWRQSRANESFGRFNNT